MNRCWRTAGSPANHSIEMDFHAWSDVHHYFCSAFSVIPTTIPGHCFPARAPCVPGSDSRSRRSAALFNKNIFKLINSDTGHAYMQQQAQQQQQMFNSIDTISVIQLNW